MSEVLGGGRRRRRRSDADRSAAAVLDAAVRVLGQQPEASMDQIAAAAGVARQTVYAHYPSRQVLLAAVVDQISNEVLAAMDEAGLDTGSATAALVRWLDTNWSILERYPLLLHPSLIMIDPQESYQRHGPIIDRLQRLIGRGQAAAEFGSELSPEWLVAATMALGHAAGEEVAAGRMTSSQASLALRVSILRLYAASDVAGLASPG